MIYPVFVVYPTTMYHPLVPCITLRVDLAPRQLLTLGGLGVWWVYDLARDRDQGAVQKCDEDAARITKNHQRSPTL